MDMVDTVPGGMMMIWVIETATNACDIEPSFNQLRREIGTNVPGSSDNCDFHLSALRLNLS